MVKYAAFTINGQKFVAMDNGHEVSYGFTPAVSFVINCHTQEQVDYYWDHLTEGGDINAQQCGWLQDKYGVSWQVVPEDLAVWMSDPEKSEKIMKEVLKMKKLDLNRLKSIYSENQGENSEFDFGASRLQGKDSLTPNEEL